MSFDYRKLRGRIREVFGTQEAFAKAIRLSTSSVSAKLNNRVEWTQQEINEAARALGIDDRDISDYFFSVKV